MEQTSLSDLPLELHALIISFVDRFKDLAFVKRTSKLYYQLANEVDLMKVTGIKWDQGVLKYFLNRKPISNDDVTVEKIKERWIIDEEGHSNLPRYSYTFKTTLHGNMDVGKTTLTLSAQAGRFKPAQPNTTICAFVTKECNAYGVNSTIQFWDPTGIERYLPSRITSKIWFRQTNSALFCFDLSNRSTLIDLFENWMIGFPSHTDILPDDVVFYLVGLKSDLKDPKDSFSAEAQYLAKQFSMRYYEVSSQNYEGIEKMMQQLNLDMLKTNYLRSMKQQQSVPNPQPQQEGRWRCSIM